MNDANDITITEDLQIPLSELGFSFSPSRGPGGQHVNRAHTRATLLFDIASSPSLDEPTREKLLHALASKLDSRGVLHITSQDTRSQIRNREAALARFAALLSSALEEQPERVATKPSAAVEDKRREEKKRHSRRKEDRGHDWSKDV